MKPIAGGIPGPRAPIVTHVPGHRDIELVRYYDAFLGYYAHCEPETKRWFVEHARPDWVVLDCGANVGYYSILLSRLCPRGRVYAFEPTVTADMLLDNLRHCGALHNVEVVRSALGAKCGDIEDAIFRIWGQSPERQTYSFTTIDAFVAERGLAVQAIKIDVDSFDYEVLQGAQQTLIGQDPYVMVELNEGLNAREQSVSAALSYMASLGYRECHRYDRENFLFKRAAPEGRPGAEGIARLAEVTARVEKDRGREEALNWATIPHVNRRAAARVGATDLEKGFWLHMLDLYSTAERPVGRVLSLACGLGHQERTLARFRKFGACDALDISPAALEKARELAEAEGLSQIKYECRDLNELKLTERYDIVIAGGVHHVSNLENLFAEVSRSLAPGGFMLMYEYIGPARCQPTARQVEAINACIRLLPKKYRVRVSAQRELGVSTAAEALAAIEAQRAAARAAVAAGPESRGPGGPDGGPRAETSGAREGACAPEAADGAPMPRPLELLGRAGAAVKRGDFFFRLRMYLIRWLQPSVPVDPAPEPTLEDAGPDPGALATSGGASARPNPSADGAGEPATSEADDEMPDRYFWNRYVPMTREQWEAVDPAKAVRSDEIVPLLGHYFKTVDVRYTGGSIVEFSLYDIAGNFGDDTAETRALLDMLFRIEDTCVKYDDVPEDYAVIVARNE